MTQANHQYTDVRHADVRPKQAFNPQMYDEARPQHTNVRHADFSMA